MADFDSLDEIILPTPLESLKCASEDAGNINFLKDYKFEAYKCAVEGMALTHPKLPWQIPLKVYGNNFFSRFIYPETLSNLFNKRNR